jgi:hypothetical protein
MTNEGGRRAPQRGLVLHSINSNAFAGAPLLKSNAFTLAFRCASHYIQVDLLHRTIAAGKDRRSVMLNAIVRWFERVTAPLMEILEKMPPSDIRQVFFPF